MPQLTVFGKMDKIGCWYALYFGKSFHLEVTAYINMRLHVTGRSMVYKLNNVGARTQPRIMTAHYKNNESNCVQLQCLKHFTGKPVDVLCQANICNTSSIVWQEVYVRLQDECIHGCLVVLRQHCNITKAHPPQCTTDDCEQNRLNTKAHYSSNGQIPTVIWMKTTL